MNNPWYQKSVNAREAIRLQGDSVLGCEANNSSQHSAAPLSPAIQMKTQQDANEFAQNLRL